MNKGAKCMDVQKLKPYKSFLFCSIKDASVQQAVSDIKALVKDNHVVFRTENDFKNGNLKVSLFTYKDQKTPSWCSDLSLKDTINHLVLLVQKNNHIAIYTSESAIKEKIRNCIIDKKKKKAKKFTYLRLIPQGQLNAAFVKGKTQTLWLSGTHKRTAYKVDNKIITGLDLQYALDPLGDQSFFFTAVRCKMPDDKYSDPVGISPRKSAVWAGIAIDWNDFIESVKLLLTFLEEPKKKNDNPLPILATSLNSTEDLKDIGKCYDAAIIPPILLAETDVDPDERERAEQWSDLRFKITTQKKSLDFDAEISFIEDNQESKIGIFSFIFNDEAKLPRISWEVKGQIDTSGKQDVFNKALEMFNNDKEWLKLWYDSGHVVADREIFLPRYRDIPFNRYEGKDLNGFSIKREKPSGPIEQNIGKENSLFCYTQKTLTNGWLTSDDGSMEIADFIHFDSSYGTPYLSLIHVKASKKEDPKRGLSVSDYEVVVSQAVKNIRYLNKENLLEGLKAGLKKKIQKATWKNGKKQNNGRKGMLEEIEKHGTNINFRVIVFQPRARISEIDKARKNKASKSHKILQQLDTLLLGASLDCQSAGAEFITWIDGN